MESRSFVLATARMTMSSKQLPIIGVAAAVAVTNGAT
jgi:hypothetical protein